MITAAFSDRLRFIGGSLTTRLKTFLFYIVGSIILVSYQYCDSLGKDLQLNDSHLHDYADHLYKNGEYYRAVTEYKRLLFFFPDSEFVSSTRFQIGRSYMAGDQLDDATRYWKQQLDKTNYTPNEFQKIRLLLGISLLDLNQLELFHFRESNINEAMNLFADMDDSQRATRLAKDFSYEWQHRELQHTKSPWMAGLLSTVLPGSGSVYNGRYLEGIYSLFLTGLFYLATRDAIHHERDELAVLFGLATLGFYGSGIYTAVNGSYKINDRQETDELLRLREKYGIWFIPASESYPGRF